MILRILFIGFAGLSLVFIFINFFVAILMAIISFVFWIQSPEGISFFAQMQAQAKEQLKKQKESEEKLNITFNELLDNPNNESIIVELLRILESLVPVKRNAYLNSIYLPLLHLKPLDARVRDSVASIFTNKFSPLDSSILYSHALEILEKNPTQKQLKIFSLEVGRWHYGKVRKDGKVTIYDEQATQNDINVRSN